MDCIQGLPQQRFSAGQQFIREGETHEVLWFLKSGQVEIERGGQRITLIKTPGSVLGEMSFLLNRQATANVTAVDDVTCLVAEDPVPFLREHPEVAIYVARALAYRLEAATRYLVDVKEQMTGVSDHVSMVDSVLDTIVHRDLKNKIPGA